MRFKQFLLEMPQVDDRVGTLADKKEYWDYTIYKDVKDYKEIEKIDKNISLYKKDDRYEVLYKVDNKIYGIVYFTFIYSSKEAPYCYPNTSWIAIHPDYRRKGIVETIYKFLINKYGGIISDSSLTNKSHSLYKKISKDYFIYTLPIYGIARKYVKVDKMEDVKNDERIVLSKKEIKENIEESYFQSLLEMPSYQKNFMYGDDDIKEKWNRYKDEIELESYKKDNIEYIKKENIYFILMDGNVIGFNQYEEKEKYIHMWTIALVKEYQRKGIVYNFYKYLINVYGIVKSSLTLTKTENGGSYYVYEKLLNTYYCYVLNNHDKTLKRINEMPKEHDDENIIVSKKELKSVEDLK